MPGTPVDIVGAEFFVRGESSASAGELSAVAGKLSAIAGKQK